MPLRRRLLFMFWSMAIAAPMVIAPQLALAEPTAEDLDQNRKKFEQIKLHPEHLAQLRRTAKTFLSLSPKRRDELLQLDHELHEKHPSAQVRLARVLDRYNDWQATLSDDERKRIADEPDKSKRLAIIRELRDQEFMKQQPGVARLKYESVTGKARGELVRSLRQEDRKRRQEWEVAQRFWTEIENKKPLDSRIVDLPKDVQLYVNEYLKMFLSSDEWDRLDKSQGQWPQFMMTLVELADRHPPAVAGPDGPRFFKDLPADLEKRLKFGKLGPKFKLIEGTWPRFGEKVSEILSQRGGGVLPYELWPTGFKALSPPMQDFVQTRLGTLLTKEEHRRLQLAEEKPAWPNYPNVIQELARAHDLRPPWFTLPAKRDRWDPERYRVGK